MRNHGWVTAPPSLMHKLSTCPHGPATEAFSSNSINAGAKCDLLLAAATTCCGLGVLPAEARIAEAKNQKALYQTQADAADEELRSTQQAAQVCAMPMHAAAQAPDWELIAPNFVLCAVHAMLPQHVCPSPPFTTSPCTQAAQQAATGAVAAGAAARLELDGIKQRNNGLRQAQGARLAARWLHAASEAAAAPCQSLMACHTHANACCP